MPTSLSREEVKNLLSSLLIARKEALTTGVPIVKLDYDFKEETGIRIPFREFGHGCLVDFLRSLPDGLSIRPSNGMHYAYPVVSEKTQHVSNLVAGQNRRKMARPTRRLHKPSAYYPKVQLPPMRLSSKQLTEIAKLVKNNVNGIHHSRVLDFVKKNLDAHINWMDLKRQLADIAHEVEVAGDWLYPAVSPYRHQEYKQPQPRDASTSEESRANSQPSQFNERKATCRPAGFSHSEDDDCSKDFYAEANEKIVQKEDNKPKENHPSNEKTPVYPTSTSDKNETVKCPPGFHELQETTSTNDDATDNEAISHLINERTRIRLQKLIEKHPDGIWCADLPQLYRNEYTIPLNYEELGFVSVIEFVSHLPGIFQSTRPQDKGDFKLYNAKTGIPDAKPRERPKVATLATLHNIYEQYVEPTEAIPSVLSKLTMDKLIPDGVMTANETVAQICVTELNRGINEYINVIVCDVYTPTFFWIQLFRRIPKFQSFMNELHAFYEREAKKYVLPLAVMEKGMNCACTYDGKWHRAIIKTVRPDNYVTVLFYDYGTIKSYPAESIHFLHRKFSNIPAQAIPCGLYNVKPVSGTQWPWNVACEFVNRTTNVPLVATIASIDTDTNSMMVALTNTDGPEDFHINDWMVQSGFAVYGSMVRIRPRNYPFRRFLECKSRISPQSGKELLSSDTSEIYSKANNARIENDLMEKRDFYDSLLKLHRVSRLGKISASPLLVDDSTGEECENRRFSSGNCEESVVKDENKTSQAKLDSGTRDQKINKKLLKDLCESHQSRKLSEADRTTESDSPYRGDRGPTNLSLSGHFLNSDVRKNQHSNVENPQSSMRKQCITEIPTDDSSMTDEDRAVNPPNEVVPLHLRNSGPIESLPEFGTLHSRFGGNGRMEFIDWSMASKPDKIDKKATNIPSRPTEIGEKISKDVTKHESKVQERRNHESNKSLKELESRSDVTGKENTDNSNWDGPKKLPVARRALWDLVKKKRDQSSSGSGETECEKEMKGREGEANVDSVKKKTPIFFHIEEMKVPTTINNGADGDKGHWKAVPLEDIKKLIKNSETKKKVSITKKNHKLLRNEEPSNLPKADKCFVRIVDEVILSDCAKVESAPALLRGNIKPIKDIKPRLKMMKNRLKEQRQERVKLFIPDRIMNIIRSEVLKDSSDDDQAVDSSSSQSKESKTLSESLSERDESSDSAVQSTKSVNLIEFSDSKDSSSEISTGQPIQKSSALEINLIADIGESSTNKPDLLSNIKGSSCNTEEPGEKGSVSDSPQDTNAWLQNVCLKSKTPLQNLIHSHANSTFNSTLDSDDLSFEETKIGKDKTFVAVDSPLISINNSLIEERSLKNGANASLTLVNEELCDLQKKMENNDHKKENELMTVSSKPRASEEVPVFDDLNLESNDDEWDYSPGWRLPEVPETCETVNNCPEPSGSQSVVIEEVNSEQIDPSDESSIEMSEDIDIDTRSHGSSRQETDTDPPAKDCKSITIDDDSFAYAKLNLTEDSMFNKSELPLDDDESRTPSRSCDFRNDKKPLIDPNSSSNDESLTQNATPEQSSLSGYKRYSILSEIQKSPMLNKPNTFAALDDSSSGEKSDTSYKISLIKALKRYF
ncbi:uncharacterized protein [Venturia canescens]|uniref:uncharacterized protein isoform X1 n=1 Tax=Venturia canescens TaxID=32260 RepID=UPI001C9CB6AD|nr:uncharacterized protein LOC122411104 isoform X1 [Venturia canescens]